MALGKTSTTNNRQGLTALSTITGQQEFLTSTNGALDITGGGSGGGGTQYTQGGATVANPTGNSLIFFDNAQQPWAVSTTQGLPITLTDDTNTANVVPGDTGFNGLATAGASNSLNFSLTATGTSTPINTEGYGWVEIQYTSVGTGIVVAGQFSSDGGTTWTTVSSWQYSTNTSNANSTLTGVAGMFVSSVWGKLFRINLTGITGGTQAGVIVVTNSPRAYSTMSVVGNVGLSSISPLADGTTTTNSNSALQIYNGTNLDRVREASTVANTTGTGLLGVGNLGFDGTNYQTIGAVAADAGFTGLSTAGATKTIAFTTSTTGAQTLLANTSVEGYDWMTIVYTSVGTGLALTAQFSPINGGTYIASNSFQNGSGGVGVLGTAVNTNYNGPVYNNFFQLNVTSLTGGTFSGFVTLHSNFSPLTNAITLNAGTANIGNVGSNVATGSAVPPNAFYIAGINTSGNLRGIGVGDNGDAYSGAGDIDSTVYLYNGTTYDRQRNNITGVLVASATTSTQAASITTYNASGAVVTINIASGSGSVTVALSGTTSQGYTRAILTSTAITGAGTYSLRIGKGLTPSANAVANDILPRTLAFTATVSGTISYGIDYELSV